MAHDFKVGDHVEWNSQQGLIRGKIKEKHSSEFTFQGHAVAATKDDIRYVVQSDKTDHLAQHKGSALKLVR